MKANGVQNRIQTVISSTGLSDAAFARSVDGFNKANLSQILKGNRTAPDSLLRAIARVYNIRYNWLLTGEGEIYNAEQKEKSFAVSDVVELPLLPVNAMAGSLSGDNISIMEYECEKYIVPIFKGAEFLIMVQGDSMMPKYMPGDIVACKRVHMDRLWFQWGKTYVIGTTQGTLIKRIEPSDQDGCISIHSDNPKYKPFNLPAEEIYNVALVLGAIRVE